MLRSFLRLIAAAGFVLAGLNHFRNSAFYERIVPPNFPSPKWLVLISGIAEIVGGLGLLLHRLRRPAGIGLIALLLAVFPANIYMAVEPERAGLGFPKWALWVRLPMQLLFIVWVSWVAFGGRASPSTDGDPMDRD